MKEESEKKYWEITEKNKGKARKNNIKKKNGEKDKWLFVPKDLHRKTSEVQTTTNQGEQTDKRLNESVLRKL